jgi:RHS repeat-associated protein
VGAGVVSLSRYKPWGESNGGAGTKPTDYGFTGQRSMDYIGLDWYSSRWYDSSLGRWAQPDTIIQNPFNSLNWDRYQFVESNPVKNTDPTGHISCEECVEGGGQEIPLVDPIGPVNEAAGASEVVDGVPESPGGPVETFDTLESSPDLPEQLTNNAENNGEENNGSEAKNETSNARLTPDQIDELTKAGTQNPEGERAVIGKNPNYRINANGRTYLNVPPELLSEYSVTDDQFWSIDESFLNNVAAEGKPVDLTDPHSLVYDDEDSFFAKEIKYLEEELNYTYDGKGEEIPPGN